MPAEAVPDALWPRLTELIAEKTGLHFPPERRTDLQRGLTDAAAELGFADSASYADWLLSTPLTAPHLQSLASHLTIGETYFFRERKTFDALAERILPELIARRRGREQRLRLWSAACSSGEEPYSLAILLHELLPDWKDWRVTILATDINKRFLQKAAAGVYGEWSFRDSPPAFRERYFTPASERRCAVVPEIRERVSFAQLNLAEDRFPSLATDTNAMDVILCRNLLIYFAPQQARQLVAKLRHSLLDDGWLAVSPSECSQALFQGFTSVSFPGAILYRKGDAHVPPPSTTASEPTRVPPPAPFTAAESAYEQGRYADASETLLSVLAETSQDSAPQEYSLLTRSLANEGKLPDALAWSERWIAADKLDAAAHYLNAMVLRELGKPDEAQRSLQRAIYLQPEFALAHVALGNLAPDAQANRHFENALRILRARPPQEAVPESDGLTAVRLTEMVTALLAGKDRR